MRRRSTVARMAVALLVGAVALAGCGGGAAGAGQSSGVPDPQGVFVRSVNLTDLGGLSFDPATLGQGMYQFTYPVTNSFLKARAGGQYEPDLAERVTIVDPSTIEVVLRPELKFSDGAPLNAQAAVTSIERTRDAKPAGLRVAGGLDSIAAMTVDSPTQFTITLKTPTAGRFYALLAEAETTPVSPNTIAAPGDHRGDVVTAGPFKIESYDPGVQIRLVKNDLYWDAANVRLGAVEYRHAGNGAAAVNALRGAGSDFVSGSLLTHNDLKGLPPTFASQSTTLVPWGVSMCMKDGSPLGDVRVRQALNYATDRDAINKLIYGGDSRPAWALTTPEDPAYDTGLEGVYEYNPERARQLLAEAGYPGGFSIRAMTNAAEARHHEILQQQWAQVGVQISVTTSANITQDWYLAQGANAEVSGVQHRPLPESLFRNFGSNAISNVCDYPLGPVDECAAAVAALEPSTEEYRTRVKECQEIVVRQEAVGVNTVYMLFDSVWNASKIANLTWQLDQLTQPQPDVTKIFVQK